MATTPKKESTETSSFGTGGRISHDSSAYYSRAIQPDLEPVIPYDERPIDPKFLNSIIETSSESMKELPDSSVHLMITSPPYNVGKDYDDDLSLDDYRSLLKRVLRETYRVLVPGGRACINIANLGRRPYLPLHSFVIADASEIGFLMRGEIIWDKDDSAAPSTAWGSWASPSNPILRDTHEYILVFSKNRFDRANPSERESDITGPDFMTFTRSVWVFPAESATRVDHPAPYPVALPQRLMQLYSFRGDVILDPFMGSGTTAVAALHSGRRYVGYEVDERYRRAAEVRIESERNSHSANANIERSVLASPSGVQGVLDPSIRPARTKDAISQVVLTARNNILGAEVTTDRLQHYFDDCFAESMKFLKLIPAWACVGCLTVKMGTKPERCPKCSRNTVFEVGSFQSRASHMSRVFVTALRSLLDYIEIEVSQAPRSAKTHDLEIGTTALAARGSPRWIPLGLEEEGTQLLQGPGMLRTDTQKKAAATAEAFKAQFRNRKFIVATNAMNGGPVEEPTNHIDCIVNVTDEAGLDHLRNLATERD
ncbi:MAG: site-specific DNA-methyltransferase [Chloroflexi bacterium]|nr:site-specific DNA-methyltransferase [Chloroflexota bacterium]